MNGLIGLAMEVPTYHLEDLIPLTDLDFAVAHRVVQDEDYASFYRRREPGRELILDNSMHEIGAPVSWEMLREAADLVKPNYVIIPDSLIDFTWSFRQIEHATKHLESYRLAVNLVGDTYIERRALLDEAYRHNVSMLCLPYRKPRLEAYLQLDISWWSRIHLLGVSSLDELRAWTTLVNWRSQTFQELRVSVDTSKAVKWGIRGRYIGDGQDIRHAPISSADLLSHKNITNEQFSFIIQNVCCLRNILGHGLPA